MIARWSRFFSSVNGSSPRWTSGPGVEVASRSCRSMSASPEEPSPLLRAWPVAVFAFPTDVELRELAERLRGGGPLLRHHDRDAFIDGTRDLSLRRHEDVVRAAEDLGDVVTRYSDVAVRAVE